MVVDREVGESTMIRVSTELREMIEEEKIIPREPLNDCIKRGILENRKCRAQHLGYETRASLKTDLEEYTTNPDIGHGGYWEVWRKGHPDEIIYPDDLIHHINGNHNDDRLENLMKVKRTEHGAHNKDSGVNAKIGPTKSNDIVGKT